MTFRTFTGAAPLKPVNTGGQVEGKAFLPHLHGCGPTEALRWGERLHAHKRPFRTFTGAAPLKRKEREVWSARRDDLPHLHGCGPTEAH